MTSYIFQGQMAQVTLRGTAGIKGEMKSMGCWLMEAVRRFQRSSVNTAALSFDTFYLQWCQLFLATATHFFKKAPHRLNKTVESQST